MEGKSHLGALNVIVFVFTIIVLTVLTMESFLRLSDQTIRILKYMDYSICFIFFIEFTYRLFTSKNKLAYLKWGWIDLVSSIPMIEILRWGRVFQLIRILRLLKAFKSSRHLLHNIFSNRAEGTVVTTFLLAFLLIILSSIAILHVETAEHSNIKTAEDAIWWSYTTITTVGYGDLYPVTSAGRLVAIILMTFGVGVFGTLAAYISSTFINRAKNND